MGQAGIFSRLDTVILRVKDLRRAMEWYEQKLGLTASSIDERENRVAFDLGGTTSLTLWQLKPGEALPARGAAGTYPIFSVDDAEGTHARLRSRGVTASTLQTGGGVCSFSFFDLDGNRLEVCQILVG
jgi:predicted enzyme related to lactoylglutathione lyase